MCPALWSSTQTLDPGLLYKVERNSILYYGIIRFYIVNGSIGVDGGAVLCHGHDGYGQVDSEGVDVEEAKEGHECNQVAPWERRPGPRRWSGTNNVCYSSQLR